MMLQNEIPLLEFDESRGAMIRAAAHYHRCLPERCVITFFRDALEKLAAEEGLPVIGGTHSEAVDFPIYEAVRGGERLALTLCHVGAPGAAGTLEELHAMGCERFVVCGGAGVLTRDAEVGALFVPTAAVRDEGTSFHYLPPSREVACDAETVEYLTGRLREWGFPFVAGKTWTTDGFYRETAARVARRRAEGCLTVEMEAAAFFAVSQFYGLRLCQLLYAGDDLSGESWDKRGWNSRMDVREKLIALALDLCAGL